MPHDRNGVEVKVGDRVLIDCEVLEVTASEQYCNLKLKPVHPANPPEMDCTIHAINAAVVEKPSDEPIEVQ